MNDIVNIEPGQNRPPETMRVCVSAAEKALIRPATALPLSVGSVCASHHNVLIYSSLKLNAAVNAPCDSIKPGPLSSTGAACAPLIKLQNAIERAKIRLWELHLGMPNRPLPH